MLREAVKRPGTHEHCAFVNIAETPGGLRALAFCTSHALLVPKQTSIWHHSRAARARYHQVRRMPTLCYLQSRWPWCPLCILFALRSFLFPILLLTTHTRKLHSALDSISAYESITIPEILLLLRITILISDHLTIISRHGELRSGFSRRHQANRKS